MVRSAVLLISCMMLAPLDAMAFNGADMSKALEAARNDDWDTLASEEARLGDNNPLQAYLDFHRLRAALPDLAPGKVTAYAARYPDSPLPTDVRQLAMVAYARAEKWDKLLALTDTPPRAVELRCYYYRAKLQSQRDEALHAARKLWLTGHSRPASCDPLFDAAREAGVIDDDAIWKRQKLAFYAGSSGLQRYLNKMLDDDDSQLAQASDWLLTLYKDPTRVDDLPASLPARRKQALLAAGLHRWAYVDTVAARQWFEAHSRQAGLTRDSLREKTSHRIAWYSTIRGIEENRDWLDHWLQGHDDPALLEQRARRGIIEQDWADALTWINRLSDSEQADARWLYWRARALEETHQEDQAREAYRQAARQRNFFAFMAADRLGEPYRFSNDSPETAPYKENAAIVRIRLLRDLGEPQLAHQEWQWLMQNSSTEQVNQLAALALKHHWYDLAVQASIRARAWDTLAWRFPPAYQQRFQQAASRNDLDPWLAMAVARRESAFYPHAHSPVGALGLMQLMPATARKVAREANQGSVNRKALFDPDTNITLGSEYLASLLKDFKGNRVLALAAYNAGPSRVNSWLAEEPEAVPADVWIEAIPFRETRDYVQAVLTYRALFVGLHDNQSRTGQLLTRKESATPYSLGMLD
ncbi:lytic transglycosylase [Alcanivorax hongdengensis A-11-3]|uniref:Lytic transglycosylase n=1 Tax=Alcanivorax hongdengensis A-11-3 TaxID=1177179 RepID=L0WGU6_9GAMM|nr:transglycosylase SLT domain-containing protein [Alcanivorax hongdengensis]EKF75050.1 lytic transglycosylase [Alcanivorax hongdengensis A-11-3]